jgi:hypothetical protein
MRYGQKSPVVTLPKESIILSRQMAEFNFM